MSGADEVPMFILFGGAKVNERLELEWVKWTSRVLRSTFYVQSLKLYNIKRRT